MPDEERDFIIPRYKLILSYDILAPAHEEYFQFVMGELVPSMQGMNVYMTEAWHTAYGDYPLRMASFVAEDYQTIRDMLESEHWRDLERRFLEFVRNYSLKVVRYRRGFQFVR